jgi:hypothetical protein
MKVVQEKGSLFHSETSVEEDQTLLAKLCQAEACSSGKRGRGHFTLNIGFLSSLPPPLWASQIMH